MCHVRIGNTLGEKKSQATPTKQDISASWGFFSKFPTSRPRLFLYGIPSPGELNSEIPENSVNKQY